MNLPAFETTADGKPREHLEPTNDSRLTCPHGLWWHISCKECDANRERVAAQLNCPVFYCKDRNHTHLSCKSAVLCIEQIDRDAAASLSETFTNKRLRRIAETEAVNNPRVTITESGPTPSSGPHDSFASEMRLLAICAGFVLLLIVVFVLCNLI